MQNFGRGMWRRLGDFERIQAPQLQKDYLLQYYLDLLEQNRIKNELNINRDKSIKHRTNINGSQLS